MHKQLSNLFLIGLFIVGLVGCGEATSSQHTASPTEAPAAPATEVHMEADARKVVSGLLPPSEFEAMVTEYADVQLIDVRTPGEYAGGTIEGATNVNVRGADFASKIQQLDPTKPVMVFCAKGGRSAHAANLLLEAGFQQVFDLDGGATGWNAAGLPLVNPE
ncbi:rhodanese-like domain-containing protein [Pontibacter sp. G13]|uniref:rhodanese-like domain-containing protein n=1 Tax=Pontibacter sp. G13 TaxID=3074898 RepID=UPI00288B78D3|nr:rhodanese-like domain-containing protein [Pontibacter sp. G13]WNJ17971.1 rhodanese-like domain-containing protein [Pontibacter sp. G13]